MNPFFIPGGEVMRSQRVYGLVDSVEPRDAGDFDDAPDMTLDCVDADWFDENIGPDGTLRSEFDKIPLSIIELRMHQASSGDLATEGAWLELQFADGDADAIEVRHYRSLLAGEGELRHVSPPSRLPDDRAAMLSKAWELPSELDVDATAIQSLLSRIPDCDFVCVLDVGQGNWNALWAHGGGALLHFDAGGGVLQHKATFPSGVIACVSQDPPVVLSHWDWDHWSSGTRFPVLLSQPWIAPRQYPLGAVHRAFAQGLIANGNLHVWPNGLARVAMPGFTIERCTGTSRNDSGLALIAHSPGPQPRQNILCTGDASYRFIPWTSTPAPACTGVVVPHHGGRPHGATSPPSPIGLPHQRLAYSYGAGNHYGHPHKSSISQHNNVGWRQLDERHTAASLPSRPAHISIPWSQFHVSTGCFGCNPIQ